MCRHDRGHYWLSLGWEPHSWLGERGREQVETMGCMRAPVLSLMRWAWVVPLALGASF